MSQLKQEIKTFLSQPESVPYASLETLRAYNKEDIAKFSEDSFDEVV